MQVQVNVIFDLESGAQRGAVLSQIAALLSAVGVDANVIPLAGNGADAGPVDQLPQTTQSAPARTPSPGRVAAAANARAAKQAQQKATPPVDDRPVGVAGGVNGSPVDVADDDTDDTDDALGLNSPSMSPGEAKDAGLALVREAYSAGHVAQVKALQKELGVAKFYDVDVTNGHAFYQRVMKLAHEVGIRR